MRVVVIGGGIAGLAAAWALVRAGRSEVVLLEREDQLFSHSSGRNAAIYRPIESQPAVTRLAVRTAALYDEALGARDAWLRRDGILLTAPSRAALQVLADNAEQAKMEASWLDRHALLERVPALEGGHAEAALSCDDGGVLDLHAIATGLAKRVRDGGGSILVTRPAARLEQKAGRVSAAVLEGGETIAADAFVIAGGAWASELGATVGAPLPLTPVRRHLVMLELDPELPADTPTVWDAELEAYFRPESGAVLASPGDATPWVAETPVADPGALELLAEKMAKMAPKLALASVRRSWACLRTFAKDKVSVSGSDPRVGGLHWLAGLGGHGITAGPAAAEVLAAAVLGRDHPELRTLSPARLL